MNVTWYVYPRGTRGGGIHSGKPHAEAQGIAMCTDAPVNPDLARSFWRLATASEARADGCKKCLHKLLALDPSYTIT